MLCIKSCGTTTTAMVTDAQADVMGSTAVHVQHAQEDAMGSAATVADAQADAAQAEIDKMPPRASLWLILYWNLLTVINIVIVVPTAHNYSERLGADDVFTGLAISITPFFAVVGIVVNQVMLRCMSMKTTMLIVVLGAIIGNVFYAMAGLTGSKWFLLSARCIIGLCAGQLLPGIYITRTVGMKNRSQVMFWYQASIAMGYAVGSFLSWLLELSVKEFNAEPLPIDSETIPGWCMAACYLVFMVKLILLFEDLPSELSGIEQQPPEESRHQGSFQSQEKAETRIKQKPQESTKSMAGLLLYLYVILGANVSTSVVDVYTAKLSTELWNWSILQTSLLLAGVMTCLVPVCLAVGKLSHKVSDHFGLLVVCPLGVLSAIPLGDFDLPEGFLRTAVWTMGITCLLSVCAVMKGFSFSAASKVAPGHTKHLVSMFAISTASLGRGAGSLLGAVMARRLPYGEGFFVLSPCGNIFSRHALCTLIIFASYPLFRSQANSK